MSQTELQPDNGKPGATKVVQGAQNMSCDVGILDWQEASIRLWGGGLPITFALS